MNYRHAFHAGNFADVLKHAVLALIIEHLKLKPAAFRVIDTHAGSGRYDLAGAAALKTGEWRDGIGRLLGPDAVPLPTAAGEILKPYLDAVLAVNAEHSGAVAGPQGALKTYPGSPVLALRLMRKQDRLIANELHPEDRKALEEAIGRDPRAKMMTIDGWQALKALLPPKERRGLVLVDPPFEEAGEFDRLVKAMMEAHRRFETGSMLIWLPIKDVLAVQHFYRLAAKAGPRKILLAELRVGRTSVEARLQATALVITNPPFRLDERLKALLPFLCQRLAQGEGSHRLTWLAGCAEA